MTLAAPGGEITVLQAPDGAVRVEARLERDTAWLTQAQMAQQGNVQILHILAFDPLDDGYVLGRA